MKGEIINHVAHSNFLYLSNMYCWEIGYLISHTFLLNSFQRDG